MKYLEVEVRTASIVHGYDENNREILETVNETEFVRKLVALDRIQSVSERYLLVTGSHGRVMYWEYRGHLGDIRLVLKNAGLVVD